MRQMRSTKRPLASSKWARYHRGVKKLIIAGNWKLYINDAASAKKITAALKRKASSFARTEIVLLPTAPLLSIVASQVARSSIALGAQAISPFSEGAYTGYISADAVKNAGATWTLVGHSEQRAHEIDGVSAAGTRDDALDAQVRAAHEAGLKVLLCVGERERDPSGAHFSDVANQLTVALKHFPKTGTKLAIAYEPVWAIGKNASEACSPADVEEMSIFIRRTLTELFDRTTASKIPILYGGSVDATNAYELLSQGGVGGFLVGRASANAQTFIELLQAVQTHTK
jgi:triosephosphate isomerase